MAETKATPAVQTVTVYGPNLPTTGAAMHVHAAGCADTRKGFYRGHHGTVTEATCIRAIVQDIYADFDVDDDNWEAYAYDVKVFPCVHLPAEEPARCGAFPASGVRSSVPCQLLEGHAGDHWYVR